MNQQKFLERAFDEWSKADALWYKKVALDCIKDGHWWLITGRADAEGYLARFWVTRPSVKYGASRHDCPWDVENAVLLHLFLRPDDDAALHDHPCSFTAHILSGWYDEARPPEDWELGSEAGPNPRLNVKRRPTGARLVRRASDLHAVVGLPTDEETWTAVTMGEREREWGFHPEGKLWVPAHEYLKENQ